MLNYILPDGSTCIQTIVTGVEVSTGFVFPLSTQVLGYWTKYVKLRKYKQDVYLKTYIMVEHTIT